MSQAFQILMDLVDEKKFKRKLKGNRLKKGGQNKMERWALAQLRPSLHFNIHRGSYKFDDEIKMTVCELHSN